MTVFSPLRAAGPRPTGHGSSPVSGGSARRTRRRLALAVLLLGLVLAGTGGWLLMFSSVLATQTVTVTGTRATSRDEVLAAARVPLGRPLPRQDLDGIAASVVTLLPIESAQVERSWPHTLAISVVERTPTVAVRAPEGWLLVDRRGVAFRTVSSLPPDVLPVEEVSDPAALREAAAVPAALPRTFAAKVVRIRARSAADLTLVLNSGLQVTWGTAADTPLKAQVAAALLKRDPRAINVSVPHSPTTR